MSTHNICFHAEIRKLSILFIMKTYLYKFDPTQIPLLYSKTGVYRGIHYFSYFAKKT